MSTLTNSGNPQDRLPFGRGQHLKAALTECWGTLGPALTAVQKPTMYGAYSIWLHRRSAALGPSHYGPLLSGRGLLVWHCHKETIGLQLAGKTKSVSGRHATCGGCRTPERGALRY